MIINAIDLFTDIRKSVEMDRQLAKDYGLVFIELLSNGDKTTGNLVE